MLSLTISQASDWCQVQNLLSKELLLQWNHSPVSAISNAEGNKFKELLACGSQLIGFCDGSWKRNSVGFKAGIGGLIFKSSGEAILSFFGPSLAATSFDSEWEALSCLREAFLGSEWSKCQLTIFTDSRQVFCNFLENSLKFHQSAASKENAYLNCQNIRVKVPWGDVRLIPVLANASQLIDKIYELWNLDMGLGQVGQQFVAVHEADLVPAVVDEAENQIPIVEDEVQDEAHANVEGVEIIELE
ncbi:hypothetical protein ACET3Z_020181 [Daucus carota]